ncbi:MAG: S46 family peptidase [Gemmatimonadaceae bacterium]
MRKPKMRMVPIVLITAIFAACAPAQVAQAPTPQPAPSAPTVEAPVTLQPVGYRSEFGTMWTFDAPPLDYWRSTYNFTPDQAWLDRVRIASIRLPNCSASFVSATGLVMTNNHCVRECTAESSPPDSNYIRTGFVARSRAQEKRCAGMYVDQLETIEDVTSRVRSAVTATTAAEQATQRTTVTNQIRTECAQRTGLTCQVVSLYAGGIYSVYTYRRYDDVRLVFTPEESVAAFGGDPDNFTYPRYNLDVALLRVYVNGQAHSPQHFLPWSRAGAAENEVVFVVGNPGSTGRLNTIAQMEYLRDIGYPTTIAGYNRSLDAITELVRRNPQAEQTFQNVVFSLENSRKAVTGYHSGLIDSSYMASKNAFEREFRARIASNPEWRLKYGNVYGEIESAQREIARLAPRLRYHGFGPSPQAGGSRLLILAGQLVRMTDQTRASLLAEQPVDTLFERLILTAHLKAAQENLPAGDPFLEAVLAGRTPEQAASELVSGTRIGDTAARRALIEGGAPAIAASNDPMLVAARRISDLNRAVQADAARHNAVMTANNALLGEALFATYGTSLPPDATFTLRISDGVVKGYPMNGTIAPFKTTFMGMYARSADFDAKPPFDLPKLWLDRMNRIDLKTPFNFVSTNDIIGGNSGSPVINRNGEVVGLAFDGNIENVANRFLFRTDLPRTVSVHSSSIVEALRNVYDMPSLADELQRR